jgi:hypothetical protein
MEQIIAEVVDFVSTTEQSRERASWSQDAVKVGAEAVAVLLASGSRVEFAYFWSKRGESAGSKTLSSFDQRRLADLRVSHGNIVTETTPLGQLLRALISRDSQSFLLYSSRAPRGVVTVVLCFASPMPPYRHAPDGLIERLNTIGLATWSVKVIARLRMELKALSGQVVRERIMAAGSPH